MVGRLLPRGGCGFLRPRLLDSPSLPGAVMSSVARRCFGLAAVLLLAACADDPLSPVVPDLDHTGIVADELPAPPADDSQDGEILHFLPPLMPQTGDFEFDRTLLDWVAVHICLEADDDCTEVAHFDASGKGFERIRLSDSHYHGAWSTRGAGPGTYWIRVMVGELKVGALALAVDDRGRIWNVATGARLGRNARTIPIAFRIDADPAVRAHVMAAAGATSEEIAEQLNAEFGSDETQVAALLHDEGFGPVETGGAIQATYPEVSSEDAGIAMWEGGYDGHDVARALYEVWLEESPVIVPLLAFFGYTPEDVAAIVVDVYEYLAPEFAEAMYYAGVGAEYVIRGLEAVYDVGAAGAAELADEAGWARDQIVAGLDIVYPIGADALAATLKGIGWTADQVSAGLQLAGYGANAVTNAIEDAWEEASDWYCDNVGWPFC